MFNFKPNKLQSGILLGRGLTSTIHPYQSTPQDDFWAVKIIHADTFPRLITILQNIASNTNLDHLKILPFHGFHVEELQHSGYKVYAKLPRMQSNLDDLMKDHIQKRTRIREETLLQYLETIINSLQKVHSKGKAHGNIKPSNILLDTQGKAWLADAISTPYKPNYHDTNYFEDRDYYTSSEQLGVDISKTQEIENAQNDDLWSVGVVFLELCLQRSKLFSPLLNADEKRTQAKHYLIEAKAKYSSDLTEILSILLTSERVQEELEFYFQKMEAFNVSSLGNDLQINLGRKIRTTTISARRETTANKA